MRIATWACEKCGAEYRSEKEAAECESHPMPKPVADVGDIVTCMAGFGWYDGDRAWVANAKAQDPKGTGRPRKHRRLKCPDGDTNCFGECCTFQFYYVVTHVDYIPKTHRTRYHLATLAMKGANGYRGGWTTDDGGHHTPHVVKKPPVKVVRTSKALLGMKVTNLL